MSETIPSESPIRQPSFAANAVRYISIVFAITAPILAIAWLVYEVRMLFDPPRDLEERQVNARRWDGQEKIALIRLEGTIITGEGSLKQQIEQVMADPSVKAVVLRVNSPGGTVTGSDYILHQLKEMRASHGGEKMPLVVSMGPLAASGAYYASMAVEDTPDAIFAEPTTWTGSIGVIIPHYNFAGLLEEHGVESDSVKSHRLKGIGSITRQMTEEERAILQALVDESYERFKGVVASGRPDMSAEEIAAAATGQVWSAEQALERKLIDRIGFLEDAVARAAELAGMDERDVRLVEYSRPSGLVQFSLFSEASPIPDWRQVFADATTPRAYYLWTSLPGLLDEE